MTSTYWVSIDTLKMKQNEVQSNNNIKEHARFDKV